MKISISQQGELVKISTDVRRLSINRTRGDRKAITKFSHRSRKNLLEKFATIDKSKAKNAVFITLTYISNMTDHETAYRHIDLFLKRLEYRATKWYEKKNKPNPGFFAAWKKEFQKRGAIHFHVMAWNLPFVAKEDVANMWLEITGEHQYWLTDGDGYVWNNAPFTRIEWCRSSRKAWYYVSKYLGKVADVNPSRDAENGGGFNIATNSETGRWWGWFNRKNIPLAQEVVATLEATWNQYLRFRWDIAMIFDHARKSSLADSLKLFWFYDFLDPVTMVMGGLDGKMVFGWERSDLHRKDLENEL